MQNLKEKAGLYFEKNALRYKEDYYLRSKIHPKWIRHQRILQLVEEFIPQRHSLILDVGCGPGFLAYDLAKKGYQGFGIDISDAMINLSKDNLKDKDWDFSVRDVEQTRFEENKFDV